MARAPRTTSRMEKFVTQGSNIVPAAGTLEQAHQLDGGEVEAQVKRIMLSASETAAKMCTFKLGLFQFAPSAANFNEDEAIVISGALGNQFTHNETITMRVPKDWYIGVQWINFDTSDRTITHSLQLNYKVLN